jgi:polysaccharide biosynthesis/export protein
MLSLNRKNLIVYIGFLATIFSFSSCIHQKDFVYFQNVKKDSNYVLVDTIKNYVPTLRTDDLVSIIVSTVDPELARPFNLFASSSSNTGSNNNSGNNNNSGSTNTQGYLIDVNGNIDFPVLGSLKLAGLNRMEATSLIKQRLKAYIKDPIVNLRVMNYKVTVLGEVAHPGVFTIQNERITLPEAIGLAGDITLGGKRNNVMVIRDIDGKKIETRVNLTSRELFQSPVYYLTQNDMVYVEPTLNRMKTSAPTRQNLTIVMSGALLIVNLINLISKY